MAACAFSKLISWKDYLTQKSRPPTPDDYVFPAIAPTNRYKIGEPISKTKIQQLLDHIALGSNLTANRNGRFTTHCFRRGGAQHRFMFAEEKWSLKAVKWWGGWAEGEQIGTIMRYLLDEFVRYETGFGDMLSPARNSNRHTLFMGMASADENINQRQLNAACRKVVIDVENLFTTHMERLCEVHDNQLVRFLHYN